MRLVFIGDVCYKLGRKFLTERLKGMLKEYEADFCVVNGENSAGGKGINQVIAKEIFAAGAGIWRGSSFRRWASAIENKTIK